MARDRPAPGLAGEAASLLIPARCEEEGASPSKSSFGTRGDDGLRDSPRRGMDSRLGGSRVARSRRRGGRRGGRGDDRGRGRVRRRVPRARPAEPRAARRLAVRLAFSVPREASSDRFALHDARVLRDGGVHAVMEGDGIVALRVARQGAAGEREDHRRVRQGRGPGPLAQGSFSHAVAATAPAGATWWPPSRTTLAGLHRVVRRRRVRAVATARAP